MLTPVKLFFEIIISGSRFCSRRQSFERWDRKMVSEKSGSVFRTLVISWYIMYIPRGRLASIACQIHAIKRKRSAFVCAGAALPCHLLYCIHTIAPRILAEVQSQRGRLSYPPFIGLSGFGARNLRPIYRKAFLLLRLILPIRLVKKYSRIWGYHSTLDGNRVLQSILKNL